MKGGKRQGSGRKPNGEKKEVVSIRLSKGVIYYLQRNKSNRSRYIEGLIIADMLKNE